MDIKTDYATGVCVCLITGDKRSLHANIGAAGHFSLDLFETDDWKTKIEEYNQPEEVSLFYIEGYFIPGREDVIKFILNKYINRHVPQMNVTDDVKTVKKEEAVAVESPLEKLEPDYAEEEENKKSEKDKITEENSVENTIPNGMEQSSGDQEDNQKQTDSETAEASVGSEPESVKPEPKDAPIEENPPSSPGVRNLFATNLNAAYIVKEFSDTVKLLVESADLIFGNREEYEALATIYDGCQTIQDVVQLLMRKESELDRLKIFVITDGSDPVAVYYGTDNDFRWHRYRVPSMPSERVVDTTGAGDSFIAGFLHKFMNRGLLADCVANGCEIASEVLQNVGCTLI